MGDLTIRYLKFILTKQEKFTEKLNNETVVANSKNAFATTFFIF